MHKSLALTSLAEGRTQKPRKPQALNICFNEGDLEEPACSIGGFGDTEKQQNQGKE